MKAIFKKDYFYLFLLFVLALVIYSPSLSNLNYFWDDERFVFANPTVLDAPYWYSFWIKNSEFYKTWPVSYLLFWTIIKFKSLSNVLFLKLLNIFFHSLNSFLIYKILNKLKLPAAFFCTLFFLLHPLNVETVSWIFQLTGILSLMFFLLSMENLLIFIQENKVKNIILTMFFFQISLWSKSVAIPFVVFIFVSLLLSKKKIWWILPFVFMGINNGLANRLGTDSFLKNSKSSNLKIIQESSLLQVFDETFSFKSEEIVAPVAQEKKDFFDFVYGKKKIKDEIKFDALDVFYSANWHYFLKLLLPYDQHFIYEKNSNAFFSIAVIAILGITIIGVFFLKINRHYLLLPIWYICSVVLYLGFTYISFFYWSSMSDRYTYFLVVLSPILPGLCLKKWNGKTPMVLLGLYLGFFVFQNIKYGKKFNNPIETYKDILSYKPHPQIYSNLIEEYLRKLDLPNAEKTLSLAIEKFPDDVNLKDDIIRVNILKENLKD